MTKVEERITGAISDGVLFQFLGAENVERLKREITDVIIQQVTDDLRESYNYIISPDDMVSDIVDEIKPEVEKALYERAMAQLGLDSVK